MVSTCFPLVASGIFAAFGPRWAHRLPPGVATVLLTVGALLAAGTSLTALLLLALPLIAQLPVVASEGHWSRDVFVHHDHDLLSLAAIGCLVLATPFALRAGRRLWADTSATVRLAMRFADQPVSMSVISDPRPQAFAVPAIPGIAAPRIIATDSLLRTLDPSQRRAMLAHERSHLDRRHHLYILLTGIAATVNPLLYQLPDAVSRATERWADEDAAKDVGDRRAVALALGSAALSSFRIPRTVAAMAQAHVGERVRALMAPAPPRRRALTAAMGFGLAITAVAALHSVHETDQLFDAARIAWHHAHPGPPNR